MHEYVPTRLEIFMYEGKSPIVNNHHEWFVLPHPVPCAVCCVLTLVKNVICSSLDSEIRQHTAKMKDGCAQVLFECTHTNNNVVHNFMSLDAIAV